MDLTIAFLQTLSYHNILLFSNKAKEVTGILNNPGPNAIEPSVVDPGLAQPSGYHHPLPHSGYHHDKCKFLYLVNVFSVS